MKTATLTVLPDGKYKLNFFCGKALIDVCIWKDRVKILHELKKAGAGAQRVEWCALKIGEAKHFDIPNPQAWFWSE